MFVNRNGKSLILAAAAFILSALAPTIVASAQENADRMTVDAEEREASFEADPFTDTATQLTCVEENGGIAITGYGGTSSTLVIPETITHDGKSLKVWKIADNAFQGKEILKNVTIPSGITYLGKCAFKNCTGLTSLTINATDIGGISDRNGSSYYDQDYSPFYNAGSMSGMSVTFGNGVKFVAAYLFATGESRSENIYCKLSEVNLADSIESIGDKAFNCCYDLATLNMGSGVKGIGEYAFYNAVSMESYTLSSKLITIGSGAFYNNTGLKSIVIPDTVTGIGEYAFANDTSLLSATIPKAATSLGRGAFQNCTALTALTVNSTNLGDVTDRSASDYYDQDYAVFYNAGSMNGLKVTFGEGVERVPAYLFGTGEARSANVYCKISEVVLPDSVVEIGRDAFFDCFVLKKVEMGNGVETIGDEAFWNGTSIATCVLSSKLKTIGNYAFAGCNALTGINIPNTVTRIGAGAFRYCSSLSSVMIDSTQLAACGDRSASGYSDNSYNNSVFYAAGSTEGMTVTFGKGVRIIPAYLFATGKEIADNVFCHVSEVYVSTSITDIGKCAFYACYDLENIYFYGDAPTSIGENAFYGDEATAHYIYGNESWTDSKRGDYGGTMTWVADASSTPMPTPDPDPIPTPTPDPVNPDPSVEGVLGDVTGDGVVAMGDVLKLARAVAGYITLTAEEEKLGDVTGDGQIAMGDVLKLARYVGGYIRSLK